MALHQFLNESASKTRISHNSNEEQYSPKVIFMKTIEEVLKDFLNEQCPLLNQETSEDSEDSEDYEEVVNLFVQFLNSYAYLNLCEEDTELFDARYNKEDKEYCEIFGPEYIGDSEVEEFLSNYMIREVFADVDSESLRTSH